MRKAVVKDWVESEPKVHEWANALAKKAKATGRNYSRLLYLYWTRNKRFRAFKSTAQWLDEVREQQDSPDIIVRRAWGKELEAFNLSYKGKSGNFASKSQSNLRATVLSYLKFHIGEPEDYSFTIGTQEQLVEEARQREAETPPTREELKALYNQCRTNRDRALLLSLIHGFGLSEWLDFASNWHHYKTDIEAATVPLKVTMPFRSKTLRKSKVDSYTYLWDDSVEALKELLQERKRELGRDLGKTDNLFETDQGQPLNDNRIEILFRHLAERSGQFTQIGRLHRLRPHKIGRTFFTTEAVNASVDPAVREFVLMHKTDAFGGAYNKFHQTKKGEQLIRRELEKMRGILNLKSYKGAELPTETEEQLKAKVAKETYKTLLEANLLKPESLSLEVLKTISQRLGISFEKLVFGDPDQERLPEDVRMRLDYFDTIGRAIDLSTETLDRYMEALRVQRPTKAKSAWENHEWLWLRVEIGTGDYMQALADGFEVVDREDDGMRILRKPKPRVPTSDPTISDDSKTSIRA